MKSNLMRLSILFLFLLGTFNINAQEDTTGLGEVLMAAEFMPLFPGCDVPQLATPEKKKCSDQNLLQFVYNYIQYPDSARINGIEGSVVVRFVVETNGKVSSAEIMKDIGGGCGEEAVRVVNLMNQLDRSWSPGKQDGKAVRVSYTLPIKFKLEDAPPEFTLYGRDTVWTVYDTAASFPGGEDGLVKSMDTELTYPTSGLNSCKVGAVQIQLLVREDGNAQLLDLTDYTGLGFDFLYETVVWFNKTKEQWIPAKRGEKDVGSIYAMRVSFKPDDAVKLDSTCVNKIELYNQSSILAFEGERDYLNGEKDTAFEKWAEAIDLFPDNAETLMLRGQAALESGDMPTACADLTRAREISLITSWYDQMLFWTCTDEESEE